ncbi:AtpZ/AtpI family protein [Helicobacter sp. MIT 05-5294]|uniref:AtpZ/AtpI family protein n=1 Tax=Helicobacter sp. MIT 05-5294 TaxID=1548150 RepID=UPI000AE9BB92|nr:AtpZ/AtpI family protein [Helicobacter sp. MIT 05-5294]TLD87547.1 AtpZ/AtpI family protein [Helicobacter sp. MIT 05-5294]
MENKKEFAAKSTESQTENARESRVDSDRIAGDSESQNTNLNLNQDSTQKESAQQEPKYKDAVLAYSNATLGISMVVAVLMGVGIGYGLESLFGVRWLFWLGVVWGVCAAILNVFKAYKRQKCELDELAKDPKYAYNAQKSAKDFDDEDD